MPNEPNPRSSIAAGVRRYRSDSWLGSNIGYRPFNSLTLDDANTNVVIPIAAGSFAVII